MSTSALLGGKPISTSFSHSIFTSPQPAQAGVAGAGLAQQEKTEQERAAESWSVVVVEVSNPTS